MYWQNFVDGGHWVASIMATFSLVLCEIGMARDKKNWENHRKEQEE